MPTSPLAPLGRLVQKDERNRNYALPKLAPTRRSRFWHAGQVLDQGDTPQCVGYAGWGWLAAGPTTNRPSFTPTDLYRWAQELDEWPGTNYDGTSTLGLMKALKQKGYVGEYRWAFDAATVVAWVLEQSPIVVGTSWFMDMFTPDRMGFLEPTGEDVGGHEWLIIGADLDERCPDGGQGAVRMVNSWGRGWADHGRAWVSIKDLDFLIKHDGEAVTPLEIKVRSS